MRPKSRTMHRSIIILIVCALLGAWLTPASAQFTGSPVGGNPVTTYPLQTPTLTNGSGTITSGGTFQSVFAANVHRQGCTIQNNGSHTMYVFFGPIAAATDAKAVALAPGSGNVAGQSASCNVGGIVLTDQVSVDGTTSDAFFAAQQ